MSTLQSRLFALMNSVVPQPVVLAPAEQDIELAQLGFDSMALVSLFIELESEFDLSVQELSSFLHKRCTLSGLIALCGGQPCEAAG